MKNFIAILLFLTISILAFAQQAYQDVIYLKNGNIIRGTIIEQIPNVSIKIETSDRNVFKYELEEIEKITKEPVVLAKSSSLSTSGILKKYCGIINLGYGFGIGKGQEGLNTINFNFINGFQIFPYFSVGIGTGVKVWFIKDVTDKPIFIPAFVNLRGHFLKEKVSQFLEVDLGYVWEVSPIAQGIGFMFNPTLGVSYRVGKISRLNFGTGYSMIRVSEAESTVSMWNFIFGVSF